MGTLLAGKYSPISSLRLPGMAASVVSLQGMIRALMFDLDNTLYSEKTGMEIHVVERINAFVAFYLGIPVSQAHLIRREGAKRFGTSLEWLVFEKGFSDPDAYFRAIHPEDEVDCVPEDPLLGKLLDSLPYEKLILTNSPMEHAQRILEKLGIQDRFAAVYDIRYNGFVGKPHPKSYLKVLEDSGLDVESTVFIDDLPKYIRGYQALGGRAILKDEGRRFLDLGFERIESLYELPHVL
jgi:putative hydrolase of the HAD superfamily